MDLLISPDERGLDLVGFQNPGESVQHSRGYKSVHRCRLQSNTRCSAQVVVKHLHIITLLLAEMGADARGEVDIDEEYQCDRVPQL